MDHASSFLTPLVFLIFSAIFLLRRRKNSAIPKNHRFPPGPPGWPIIGNLLDIDRTLSNMRQKYGDVIGVKLGSINTMVVLSSKATSELFKNHDLVFADRFVTRSMEVGGGHNGNMSLLPCGSHWRVLRKLVMFDMLSNKKINETAFMRRKCMDDMSRWIDEEILSGRANSGVKIAHLVFSMMFNLMGNLIFSRNVLDPKTREPSEFMKAVLALMDMVPEADIVDFFPWLNRATGINGGKIRKMERCMGEALDRASDFVKERIEEKKRNYMGNRNKDFLDVLLEYEGNGKEGPEKISHHNINLLILEMYIAEAENISSTIEWALTELLQDPDKMRKVKFEISSVIKPNKKVEEAEIDNLPYLQAVVNETLRLHTPVPLLVPRKARQDTKFMGFDIPQNTQVFVNVWAIARDPDVWEDPSSFKPERFLGSNVDYKGQHFEFLPFGAGRRICVGLSLAHRVVHLILGSLLHRFDWELPGNVNPQSIDTREVLGITMRKLEPLLVVPKKMVH